MRTRQRDRGTTLVETMIAVLVALIGVFGLGTLIFQATVTNKNEGTEVTRATIYAQDKIERLLSFGAAGGIGAFANYASCTQPIGAQPVACNSSGITDGGWTTGLKSGGVQVTSGMIPSCTAAGLDIGYVDFLDSSGNQVTGSCATVSSVNPAYVRMWQISNVSVGGAPLNPQVKQITVGVWSASSVGNTGGARPVVVLTSYISNPN